MSVHDGKPMTATRLSDLGEDAAPALFVSLNLAQAHGDYRKAAEFQEQLREIGWVVTRRRPQRPKVSPVAGEAAASASQRP